MRTATWIDTLGGPHVVMPESAVRCWLGVTGPGSSEGVEPNDVERPSSSHYEIVCSLLKDEVAIALDLEDVGSIIVLGLPLFARWAVISATPCIVIAGQPVDVERFGEHLIHQPPLSRICLQMLKSEKLALFDAAFAGNEVKDMLRSPEPFRPGAVDVEVNSLADIEGIDADGVVVQFNQRR